MQRVLLDTDGLGEFVAFHPGRGGNGRGCSVGEPDKWVVEFLEIDDPIHNTDLVLTFSRDCDWLFQAIAMGFGKVRTQVAEPHRFIESSNCCGFVIDVIAGKQNSSAYSIASGSVRDAEGSGKRDIDLDLGGNKKVCLEAFNIKAFLKI